MSLQDGAQTEVDDMNANISRVCHVNFVSVCYDEVFHNLIKLQDYVLCWMLVRETHYDKSKYKSWAVTLLNTHTHIQFIATLLFNTHRYLNANKHTKSLWWSSKQNHLNRNYGFGCLDELHGFTANRFLTFGHKCNIVIICISVIKVCHSSPITTP